MGFPDRLVWVAVKELDASCRNQDTHNLVYIPVLECQGLGVEEGLPVSDP